MSLGLSTAAWVAIGTAGATLYSADKQSKAASSASDAQIASGQAGAAENNRRFEEVQKLLAPYVSAGTQDLASQQTLLGLNGAGNQQSAIDAIKNGPQFQSTFKQGEDAILQNASATGGLRGGNTQAALAQFRPQLLNQLIDQQYNRLGGLTSVGQNAAAGVGNAGMATGNNAVNLLGQIGSAQAGNAIAQGNSQAGMVNALTGGIGTYLGLGGKF